MAESSPLQSQPNGITHQPHSAQGNQSVQLPPEIEATLSRLSSYRSVRGVMILSRTAGAGAGGGLGGIVQCTGSIFEEESGKKYATMVEGLVEAAAKGVAECDQGVS